MEMNLPVPTNLTNMEIIETAEPERIHDRRPADKRQGKRLSPQERALLHRCESTIERGFKIWTEANRALYIIRNQKLYRETYKTFSAYVTVRWHFGASRARQLADSYEPTQNVYSVTTVPPKNEAQVRELVGQPKDVQVAAWKDAVAAGVPTQQRVKESVQRVRAALGYDEPRVETPPQLQAEAFTQLLKALAHNLHDVSFWYDRRVGLIDRLDEEGRMLMRRLGANCRDLLKF